MSYPPTVIGEMQHDNMMQRDDIHRLECELATCMDRCNEYAAKYDEARKEIARLEESCERGDKRFASVLAELEYARLDKARLDWVVNNWHSGELIKAMWEADVRAAIDAAMKEGE